MQAGKRPSSRQASWSEVRSYGAVSLGTGGGEDGDFRGFFGGALRDCRVWACLAWVVAAANAAPGRAGAAGARAWSAPRVPWDWSPPCRGDLCRGVFSSFSLFSDIVFKPSVAIPDAPQ